MKNMRKIASVLLALVMVFALAAPVFAAETDANLSGHTYKAYQIFAGTQAENNATLGNITWGDGIDGTAFLTALKADSTIGGTFTACTTAADVAGVITGWADKSDNAMAFAKIAYSYIVKGAGKACVNGETTLDAGYYLVVDETVFEEGAENTVYNLALLQLTKKDEFTIANKTDVPEVEKKVQDINDSTDKDFSAWQDSADHDIFDSVPFQLTATLASNVSDYNTYKIIFHDTLSAGLTFDGNDTVEVMFNGTNVTKYFTINCDNGELTISCNNVKEFGATDSSKIVVTYTATLNDDAVIGSAGNPNKVYLEYSNNPNWTGSGEPGTPGEPGGEEPEEPTGKTPEDVVIVFTYETIVNKIDQDGKALAGATFELSKKTMNEDGSFEWVVLDTVELNEEMTTFSWTGLDDGEYMLHESVTPDGYNTIADIYFTITATHDEEAVEPKLLTLTVDNTQFTVDAETGETGTTYSGEISADVINQSGVQLPETGGIGTTLFYIFGAVMVLGAAVLLITKKRMSIAE